MGLFRRRKTDIPKPVQSFYTKIAGVSYKNDDGSSRQKYLSKCNVREPLKLVREFNKYDTNAVNVLTRNGKQLGYLSKDVAKEIAPLLDKGKRVDCEISDLTGGGLLFKRTRGCNIKITIW
jgi:hypothetical protein